MDSFAADMTNDFLPIFPKANPLESQGRIGFGDTDDVSCQGVAPKPK